MLAMNSGRMFLRPLLGATSRTTSRAFFGQQRRQFHDFRLGMVGRYPTTIITEEQGVEAVDDIVTFLKGAEFLVGRKGCLTVVTLPEFWANRGTVLREPAGIDDDFETVEVYNAGQPLPLDTFKAIMRRAHEHAVKLPAGFLFVFGGVAVDTGVKLSDGLIRGANYGFVVESGPGADCVLFNKVHHDKIDSWDTSRYTPGTGDGLVGPQTMAIKDPAGGKTRVFTVLTCADLELGPFPADMSTSDLILGSSYGTPMNWPWALTEGGHISEGAVVAINDSSVADLNLGSGPTGVREYREAPKYPWLTGFHAVASWAGFGEFTLAAYQAVLGISPTEALARQLGFQKVATTVRTTDGLKLVATELRPFAPEPKQAEEVDDPTDK